MEPRVVVFVSKYTLTSDPGIHEGSDNLRENKKIVLRHVTLCISYSEELVLYKQSSQKFVPFYI